MLSSSVVAVLPPHWTGRPRRTKRFNITEAQGNLPDVADAAAYGTREHFHEAAELRVPFLGVRKNALDWSAKSGPASLDYESKRRFIQTLSLDVNSGKMDNKDVGSSSTAAKTASSASSHSLDLNKQRRNLQIGHEGLSSVSSKPTTSSLLLSLRRLNSFGRILNADSAAAEVNPLPLDSSPSDRDGQPFTTQLSQNSYNNNAQDMSKPLFSPPTSSYGKTETGPILSTPSCNHSERTLFETRLFSPTNKETEDAPFPHKPQTMTRAHTSLSSSKQAFLTREQSDKSTHLFSESSVSPTRHSPYEHCPLLKAQSLPRPTLTSSSWWKQVTQEGNAMLKLRDTANIADEPGLPRNLPSPSVATINNNNKVNGQILNSKDNNNTTEPACKSNKTQGGTRSLRQRNTEDLPDCESNWLVRQKYDFNSNIKEPRKPRSLPDVLSNSKDARGAAQTIVCDPKILTKRDLSRTSFTENVAKLQPTLLSPTNTHTATPSKPFPSVAGASIPSQGLACKTGSGFPLTTNTVLSDPVAPLTSSQTSSYIGASYQTPRFTKTNPTPLGFERSYSSIPKPVHPKAVTSLISTANISSKSKFTPVPTASTVSSSTNGSHPAATAASSPALLTTPGTLALASSPTTITTFLLTPPDTPVSISPDSSDHPSPKEGTTFSNGRETDTKKPSSHTEAKKVRRVTWRDSVDAPCSEPTAEVAEPISSPPPSRSPQNSKAPSIFSLLRPSSPSKNTYRLCSFSPKTSSIQVKGEQYRSLSSDCADLASRERESAQQKLSDSMMCDQGRQDLTTARRERALSVESGTVQRHSSAALSLPPDFSSGYTLRYSSPPYSTLMSNRSAQGETKAMAPRSPIFQQPTLSIYTPYIPTHKDPDEAMTSQKTKPPWSNICLPQPLSLPYTTKPATQDISKCEVTETDKINNNHVEVQSQDCQNVQISAVKKRVQFCSQSLQGDEAEASSSTFGTEALVCSAESKADTPIPKNITSKQRVSSSPASLRINLDQQSQTVQSKEPTGQSMMESAAGKSRFFSVESSNEQTPKRSRFALRKSVSTPNSSLSRSDSERVSKNNNKMDQVFNRLRQTFSTRRSEDDSSFPWKWKRASQTPSVSGSSDMSSASDITDEATKSLEKQEERGLLKEKETDTEKQSKYTLTVTSSSPSGKPAARDKIYIPSESLTSGTEQDRKTSGLELVSKKQPQVTRSPTTHQFEIYKEHGRDYKTSNQFLSGRDPSSERSTNPSAADPSQFRKSSSSPRSPFSPFPSLSPLSLSLSADATDDNVFYSPKPQRRRDSSSPREPGEGISLGGSRRSRASTGPATSSPGQDNQCYASSYADLKYGIEPGRSFSVSSVLSSRPSGPGRISTGSRFMSVDDLCESGLTCGDTDCLSSKDCRMLCVPGNDGKMRSRSLPRSLTRRLANWTSGVSALPPNCDSASTLDHLRKPNMNAAHLAWDNESPPTPPPTPPLSPVSRRMSTPPSHPSPPFPSSSGVPQQVESQSSRGQLRPRGYVSNLGTFEEFSDCSSDTTTDDEYYLETGEDGEKETEL
ncbi:uncharacterized protein [Brachionichthys hirsutus]|uniref:uncharacterized protein n=1 Tax=Brachionichthys hirsutus TaxID=412623 RepID=UPI00360490D3